MFKTKEVYLRCDDRAETVEFVRCDFADGSTNYEINIVDSYCGYDFMSTKNRFKRAWKAFWAKPVCYTGIYVEEPERVQKFLQECYSLTLTNMRNNNAEIH